MLMFPLKFCQFCLFYLYIYLNHNMTKEEFVDSEWEGEDGNYLERHNFGIVLLFPGL